MATSSPIESTMTRSSRMEVAAVILTWALHPVFVEHLHMRLAFIGVTLLGWTIYVVERIRRDRSILRQWGFTRAGLLESFRASTAFVLLAGGIMALIAARNGALRLHPNMLPLVVLYPAWGLAQQFLVQGLLVRALAAESRSILSSTSVTVLAALLFAVVHLPDLTLMAGTFLLGLVFTPIYLRWRNLWPLGLFHGWLGVLCYFWVLQRDPWIDLIPHRA
jgi:CAAX prenyl protease-like protein